LEREDQNSWYGPQTAKERFPARVAAHGEWGRTPNNCRARIYRLTREGRKQLVRETRRYRQLTLAIARVMGRE